MSFKKLETTLNKVFTFLKQYKNTKKDAVAKLSKLNIEIN